MISYFNNNNDNSILKENIFKIVFNNTMDLIFLAEDKGENNFDYVTVNNSFAKFLEIDEENIGGKSLGSFLSSSTVETLKEYFLKSLLENRIIKIEVDFCCNHKALYTEASLIPVFDSYSKRRFILIIAHDLTQHKIRESELLKMKEAAMESDRLKSALIANLNHEIRTPINGILGFSELLKNEIEDHDQKEMADNIMKSGQRLLNTLSSILQLSVLESASRPVYNSLIDVNNILRTIALKYDEEAKKKNLILRFTNCGNNIFVRADQYLFSQAVSNLIDNAIKFTCKGMIDISIKLITSLPEPKINIEVKDTGIGISKSNLELIFEEFRQVSEGYGRKYEGSGIGLSISKKIVELMKGKIYVESEIGKGSVFTIELPVILEQTVQKQSILKSSNNISTGKSKPYILVIEDNKINQ